jgi:hypothetical protein
VKRRVSHVLLAALALGGCAEPATWGKVGATQTDAARDIEQCRTEIPLAEQNYAEALTSRGYNVALERVQADPQAYAMYRADLMRLCLLSRGYRRVDMQELTEIQRLVPLPPDTAPPPPAEPAVP